MAKQQIRQAATPAPAAAAKPVEQKDTVESNTALTATEAEATEVAVVEPAVAVPPPPRDWRTEVRQLAEYLQRAADMDAAAAPAQTYYVLDVPATGEPRCYGFTTKPGLIRFLRGLEAKREQLERKVYVFAGERINITNPPRHLLLDDSRIALFAVVEDLDAPDDTISPENEEQSSEAET